MKTMLSAVGATLLVASAAVAQSHHDKRFADAMTKHHRDGIKMAQMAVDKAASEELRAMAQKMIDDQQKDIDRMQAARGEGGEVTMEMMMSMPGMMPESEMARDMARLESASGTAFDAAFTEIMARHHEGAVTMAEHEIESGSSEPMIAIAREIVAKQTEERKQLLAMHEAASPEPAEAPAPPKTRRTMVTKD
ncbi:MAG TPA: DUF305 domain-containing protein [Thermoanaerobaculia bacterium]